MMNAFDRRAFLLASAAFATQARAAAPKRPPAYEGWTPDATEIADRIRYKELTFVEVAKSAIARAEAMQPKLNFMVNSTFDRALMQARNGAAGTAPFGGVPFLVKDLDDLAGAPTRNGSRAYLGARPATHEEPYIAALESAGFITLGKSATPEHGFLPTTEPLAFGRTRNPWNLERSTGGSSGGAAAAVAAGVVPIAHASDGGGSIRIPASCCGLFGLKPSRGRMMEVTPSRKATDLGVNHVLTRSVRDSAAVFALTEVSGDGALYPPVGFVEGPTKRRLRVGLVIDTATGLAPDPEVRTTIENTAKLLESLGHHVTPTRWPIDGATFAQDFLNLWASGAAMLVSDLTKARGAPVDANVLEPFTLSMAKMVAKQPAGAMETSVANLEAAVRAYDAWFADLDVVLSPVLAKPPVPLDYVDGDTDFETLSERLTSYVGYTPLHNVAGAPAMSVPLHWTADGLPVGSHFAARAGQERMLFELAYQLERAQPWGRRKPPVSV